MTKKDYQLIVNAYRFAKLQGDLLDSVLFKHYMVGALYTQNPNFDRDKFLAACEASQEEI